MEIKTGFELKGDIEKSREYAEAVSQQYCKCDK
jgi:hypothetical protein